jgi:hypothetical protein
LEDTYVDLPLANIFSFLKGDEDEGGEGHISFLGILVATLCWGAESRMESPQVHTWRSIKLPAESVNLDRSGPLLVLPSPRKVKVFGMNSFNHFFCPAEVSGGKPTVLAVGTIVCLKQTLASVHMGCSV